MMDANFIKVIVGDLAGVRQQLYGVLADYVEDAGQSDLAAALRWMCNNHKWPMGRMVPDQTKDFDYRAAPVQRVFYWCGSGGRFYCDHQIPWPVHQIEGGELRVHEDAWDGNCASQFFDDEASAIMALAHNVALARKHDVCLTAD